MTDDEFHDAFDHLRSRFSHQTKRDFLDELEALIENRSALRAIVSKRGRRERYMAVSFDRRLNDAHFSYQYFDILLRSLGYLSAGVYGIHKPVSQLRVLRWSASAADLAAVLKAAGVAFSALDYQSMMVVETPWLPAGHRLRRGHF
ncbi:hypothetical protein [Brevundimonas variabilis]|uniref:Uncharacterized protein n=1 Tax=Brevundimonas variabilis TaxID=74312 RepID=A0A7W9CJX3_9CAUL|nr:hypothetical protein [Brevundimonas variabilis]MBB5747050.1 hypothetical protein [Brevundimonas variabilis]